MEEKSKHKIEELMQEHGRVALLGVLLLCAVCIGSVFYVRFPSPQEKNTVGKSVKLAVEHVMPGTTVSYNIYADENVVGSGNEKVNSSGHVNMVVPRSVPLGEETEFLTYKVQVEPPSGWEKNNSSSLNLLLKVHQKTGEITFSGSGLTEFSDIAVTQGDNTQKVKADWVGSFLETVVNDRQTKRQDDTIKLAFQSQNLASDMYRNPAIISIQYVHPPFGSPFGGDVAGAQEDMATVLIMMTQQLSVVMAMQVSIIGTLLDAKTQLEVQRKMQEGQARAHKDYHPSDQICRLGTFVRSLAAAETKLEMDKHALNRALMDQYLGVEDNHTAQGPRIGAAVMRNLYTTKYCDPQDNNDSLDRVCTATDRERFNKDLDYTRTLDFPLTLDVDFIDGAATNDEEDIIALAQNLYLSQMFEIADLDRVPDDPRIHYRTRSYAAKMNVAHNSFINLVAMKSRTPSGAGAEAGWNYMKALLREFGFTSDDEINAYFGDFPSYYAQMEVLTKKIYQHPNFYTNLLETPVNVDRIGVALDAISLMSHRDRYESLLRREMLTSVLVEQALDQHVEDISVRILKTMRENPKTNN